MPVDFAVVALKIALIAPGGVDGKVGGGDDPCIGGAVDGVLNGNAPGGAVGLCADGADGAAAGWLSCVAGGCCACMGVGSVTVLFFLLGGHTVVQPVLVIFYDLYGHIEFACDEVRVRTVHALGYRVLMRVDETQGGI